MSISFNSRGSQRSESLYRIELGGGGGGHSYIIEDMEVRQGFSNPITLCRPKFRQNFGSFADKWRKSFENIYPKTLENEFLVVYLCIVENIS